MKKRLLTPSHIALIPDGNRRWAKINKLHILDGYSIGIKRFGEFARWSREFGVKTLTVWALSTENLRNRSKLELKVLFGLYLKAATDKNYLKDLKENKARLRVIGDMSSLPKKLRDALMDLERQTSMYKDLTINLLINYGGKEDLVYSVQQMSKELKHNKNAKIDEEFVREHLRSAILPDVDLIVRTSGEMRTSGLLPWQGSYSELYFSKKYWPDFGREDFRKAIQTFSQRQRRYGK